MLLGEEEFNRELMNGAFFYLKIGYCGGMMFFLKPLAQTSI
jgi:hypothetical protein